MLDRRPILVTGAHRSGTGWVGRMIAAAPSPTVAYLWEPFSRFHRPGILAVDFPYWFPYVCKENQGPVAPAVADMLAFRYRPVAELRSIRSSRDVGRFARDWSDFARWRRSGARPLLKDPIALLSAEWLADTFDLDVTVLIRHPAAFVNSLTQRDLSHPFDHFLRQPLLMRESLAPFEEEIRAFSEDPRPVFDQAILLWNILHSAIQRYRATRPDWLFLRLEDVARDPIGSFREIYARLGLRFDAATEQTISAHSDASNSAEVEDPADARRDSRASIETWRRHLSPEQIDRVRTAVEPIAKEFYSDADW
ncbi:MAG: sulfotransferase [Actinomycetota bacterium]